MTSSTARAAPTRRLTTSASEGNVTYVSLYVTLVLPLYILLPDLHMCSSLDDTNCLNVFCYGIQSTLALRSPSITVTKCQSMPLHLYDYI